MGHAIRSRTDVDKRPPLEIVAGVVVGDVAPGLAGGSFEELPQPASAATAIATAATVVNVRFAIVDLRSTVVTGDYEVAEAGVQR